MTGHDARFCHGVPARGASPRLGILRPAQIRPCCGTRARCASRADASGWTYGRTRGRGRALEDAACARQGDKRRYVGDAHAERGGAREGDAGAWPDPRLTRRHGWAGAETRKDRGVTVPG